MWCLFCPSFTCSMAIIYGVFSASNLIAPSVVTVIGPQLSMFFSGLLYRWAHTDCHKHQSFSCWIAPLMRLYLVFYSGYIAMFIYPYTWSFYTVSVLVGIGAAGNITLPNHGSYSGNRSLLHVYVMILSYLCSVVLWTAQGNVLAINSNDITIGRNSGIFWALLQFR